MTLRISLIYLILYIVGGLVSCVLYASNFTDEQWKRKEYADLWIDLKILLLFLSSWLGVLFVTFYDAIKKGGGGKL